MYMFERQINCLVQKLYICIQVDNVLAHFEREGRFIYFSWREILSQQNYTISFSFMSIAKITCYLIPFSALRKFL